MSRESANPFLEKGFNEVGGNSATSRMTVAGTAIKLGILLLVLAFSAYITATSGVSSMVLIVSSIAALVLAIFTSFSPKSSPITAPLYAIAEGVLLGSFTSVVAMQYDGVVLSAILLTVAVAIAMLLVYRSKPGLGSRLSGTLMVAMVGLLIIYAMNFVLSLFGLSIPFIFGNGPIGIGFSIVVAIIAALNLIVDYDFVLKCVYSGSPKYMEWYGAFGILVTLVWLFLRIVEVLMKFMDQDNR